MAREDPLDLVGKTIDERYDVIECVDEGGYGWVYKANRVMWDKPVALKVIKQKSDDEEKRKEATEAFIAESKVLSNLSRKTTAIVQSLDIGTVEGPAGEKLLYTALEWLEGMTLAQLIVHERQSGDGGWSLERIVDTLTPVAEALAIAHASGVAHRDIKPANIFLVDSTDTDEATTKLLDFGVAKVVEDLTIGFDMTGHREGPYTPKYGAPEQFSKRHGSTGPWSDVYSLAMVCLELFSGRYPFEEGGFGHLVFQVCDPDSRPTPRALGMTVADPVEEAFKRSLALKTDDRPRDADTFWREMLAAAGADAASFMQTGRIKTLSRVPSEAMDFSPPSAAIDSTTIPQSKDLPKDKPIGSRTAMLVAGALVLLAAVYALTRPAPETTAAAVSASTTSAALAPARIDKDRLSSFAPLPKEIASPSNPLTDEKIALGRMLFYDERLSAKQDVSCNTCHPLDKYGADGKRTSSGTGGKAGKRNSLTVYNAAGAFVMMWDGAKPNIEAQALGPLTSDFEMGMVEKEIIAILKASRGYIEAFDKAFPDDRDKISAENVGKALGAFQRRLVTPSRWDTFVEGQLGAVSDDEKRGFNLFVDVGCVTCHFGPYIGLTMYQKLGLVKTWPSSKDRGRYEITKADADLMVFRVPTLRNIDETRPYFHDGSVASLDEAVRMMADHQLGKVIDDNKVKLISGWLKTLTGTIPAAYVRKPKLPE